ncbi:MAG TPA: mannose-1-phosphate guanylyltransferase, partial [Firmicutes bacterium]|nr:mannose-1-phosphate guanylyltransferase [Bacillota bacterium]
MSGETKVNHALILSGGSGTRLWPLSRKSRPKHLIPFAGGPTLLEQTLTRLDELIAPERRYLITIPEQAPIVRDVARGKAIGIIIEPIGCNNLFPMALSTKLIASRDPNAVIVFLPADHTISRPDKLRKALKKAISVAETGYIVTMGIPTAYPEPNYGHLQKTEPLEGFGGDEFPAFHVRRFHEKPPMDVVLGYTSDESWFWNGGIFIYSAATMLELISELQPELHKLLESLDSAVSHVKPTMDSPVIDWSSSSVIDAAYRNLPMKLQTSIDFAIMEHADRVATIPVDMGWSDLGGFAALSELIEPDDDGNRVVPIDPGDIDNVI